MFNQPSVEEETAQLMAEITENAEAKRAAREGRPEPGRSKDGKFTKPYKSPESESREIMAEMDRATAKTRAEREQHEHNARRLARARKDQAELGASDEDVIQFLVDNPKAYADKRGVNVDDYGRMIEPITDWATCSPEEFRKRMAAVGIHV